ncbi:MAG TPA: nucleotidyltransferase family protein [Candidatus Polarisedimenticolia bacterium]|nr:nucleotidyltransferase family protein [Candidatus Polarisedimenticolia bacterium]
MATQPDRMGLELYRLWRGSWRRSQMAFSGGSMMPLTEHATGLVVSHGSQAPRLGDVVVILQPGGLVTHRIIGSEIGDTGSRRWITQGDASSQADPPIDPTDVMGIVVALSAPHGARFIAGPCWEWVGKWAAAQTRWVTRAAGASPNRVGRWTMALHRRALRGAFGIADALENLRAGLEDWQVDAYRPPLARLIAQCRTGMAPAGDLIDSGLRAAEALGMDLLLLRWVAQRGLHGQAAGAWLERRKATVAFHQLRWRPKLEAVVQALRGIGVEPMALKGFAQSLTLYQEDALREMRDVDLLVPSERETDARAALETLGFVPCFQEPRPESPRHHHGAPQMDPGSGLVIELHREVVPERVLEKPLTDAFRSRGETVRFAGGELRVPCREDRLLHLCLHLRLHRYLGCLRDVLEIALLVDDDTPPWDWGKLERMARECGAGPSLCVGLRLAVLAFGASVPPEFLRHLQLEMLPAPLAETRIRFLARQLTGWSPVRRDGWAKAARRLCKAVAPL